jgi:branched-chain amino acid transport system ATP-binding protein
MIETRGIMLFFENMVALNEVTVRCAAGEIVGVFGANSAGKSTLLRLISGLLLDQRIKEERRGGERITFFGDVVLDGAVITQQRASERARRGIVLCPERRRLFDESTVGENLNMGAYLATSRQRRETREFVLELFPLLRRLLKRSAGLLSGGEQQMVAIGRALMAQPRFLLLDEPLLGLAPAVRGDLVRAIPQIREQRGTAVLVAEQLALPLLPVIDRGYVLENGSLVLAGNREELLANPDIAATYFGVDA